MNSKQYFFVSLEIGVLLTKACHNRYLHVRLHVLCSARNRTRPSCSVCSTLQTYILHLGRKGLSTCLPRATAVVTVKFDMEWSVALWVESAARGYVRTTYVGRKVGNIECSRDAAPPAPIIQLSLNCEKTFPPIQSHFSELWCFRKHCTCGYTSLLCL